MLSAYRYRSVLITFHEFYFFNECSAMDSILLMSVLLWRIETKGQ